MNPQSKQNKILLMLKISLVSLINTVLGISRNKIFALFLGVAGVGVIGQLSNLNSFITYFISIGIPLGITKYVSEWNAEKNDDYIYSLLRSSFVLLLSFASIVTLLMIVFKDKFSNFLWGTYDYGYLIVYISFSFPFFVATIIMDSYVRGLKRYNVFTITAITNSIISAAIFITLTIYYKEYGVGLAFFLSSVTSLIMSLIYCAYYRVFDFRRVFNLQSIKFSILNSVIKLGIASLIIGVTNQFALLYIRSEVIKEYGLEYNGYYQSIISISTSYFAIFSMIFGAHSLPLLSEKKDVKLFNDEMNSTVYLVMLLIVPIITLLYSFKDVIIPLLFSKDFNKASEYFLLFLLGDLFRILTQSLVLGLIARSRIRLWLIVELSTYSTMIMVFYIIGVYLNYGPKSFSIAYLVAYLFSLVLSLIFLVRNNKFKLSKQNIVLFLSSIVAISFMFLYRGDAFTYINFLIIPVLFIWIFYNLGFNTIKAHIINFFETNN